MPKVPVRERDPKERARLFEEVNLGYTAEEAVEEASRCLSCKKSPCKDGCPVEVDIGFVAMVREGRFLEAAQKVKERNSLPAICGRVCPQEDQCESLCAVGKKDEPVAIGRLERFVADWEAANPSKQMPVRAEPSGHRVAVIGSGPAGITAAGDLAKMGHAVAVFEALHKAGGVLVYGIPEFRLPKAVVQREVDFISSLGVEFKLNYVIGKILTVSQLFERGFDAIFLANGAGLPYFMKIEGENLNGVYSANEFLTRSNLMKAYLFPEADTPIKKKKKVAVIGGGNVAMDSARTALRLGAEKVYLVYRRSESEMPARKEEIEHAKEEGIDFRLLQSPISIKGDENGWVKSIECIRMKLGEADESGRRRPEPIEGSEFELEVHNVIVAIGQGPNPLIGQSTEGLELNKRGNIVVDENGVTSITGVFAGGDIVTGAATVILAMGAGKRAARAIDSYLMGKDASS